MRSHQHFQSRVLEFRAFDRVRTAGLLAGLSGLTIIAAATQATAHDAPSGWKYPFSCCSGYDCREVPQTSISEKPDGYVIKGTGETVGYHDVRLKDSPDGEYHWCSVAGEDNSRTICLFVPPRSY